MPLSTFLYANLPLTLLFIFLLIAALVLEYLDNGRGVTKLSTSSAIRFMNQKKSNILDLRTFDQFQTGHIKQAKHVLPADLTHAAKEWIKKLDLPVILLDEQGSKALSSAAKLKKQGYTDVAILAGGMQAWRKENLPLVKPDTTKKTKEISHAKD